MFSECNFPENIKSEKLVSHMIYFILLYYGPNYKKYWRFMNVILNLTCVL